MIVLVTMVLLGAGFLLKAQCLSEFGGFDGDQYERLCYNDLQPLYSHRLISERVFPYIGGQLDGGSLAGGAIEYPVLTGVFMWLTGLAVTTDSSYLVLSALVLAPFAIAISVLLFRLSGARALLWAAAPALALYAFHNWDLLAVFASVVGLWAFSRGKSVPAAMAFGVGTTLKIYPALFLAPLVLERLMRRDPTGAARVAGAGISTAVLINLPFALINPQGWWATYEFHRFRAPNLDSVWQLGWPEWSPGRVTLASTLLLVAAFSAVLIGGWALGRSNHGRYPVIQTCGALLAAFLLFNKVHSPQYTLWMLPFFCVLSVKLWWWVSYVVIDLAVYVGVFRWLYDLVYLQQESTVAKNVLIAGVWGRAVVLAILMVVFLWSPRVTSGRLLSHDLDSVPVVGDRAFGSQ
jgi:uncharacterized membrane protein